MHRAVATGEYLPSTAKAAVALESKKLGQLLPCQYGA